MSKIKIPRGDYRAYTVKLPVAKYRTGSKLLFGAKKTPDTDINDAQAICKVTMTDADIISTDSQYVYYQLVLQPNATDTAELTNYIAEFEFVDPVGKPTTYKQFTLEITRDINRRIN